MLNSISSLLLLHCVHAEFSILYYAIDILFIYLISVYVIANLFNNKIDQEWDCTTYVLRHTGNSLHSFKVEKCELDCMCAMWYGIRDG